MLEERQAVSAEAVSDGQSMRYRRENNGQKQALGIGHWALYGKRNREMSL
jgi:hypothetical protein